MELGLYGRRLAAGISRQEQVAKRAGVSMDDYRRYEGGKAIPTEDVWNRLVSAIEAIRTENLEKMSA